MFTLFDCLHWFPHFPLLCSPLLSCWSLHYHVWLVAPILLTWHICLAVPHSHSAIIVLSKLSKHVSFLLLSYTSSLALCATLLVYASAVYMRWKTISLLAVPCLCSLYTDYFLVPDITALLLLANPTLSYFASLLSPSHQLTSTLLPTLFPLSHGQCSSLFCSWWRIWNYYLYV